jgi:hypothetical protein
MNTEDRAPKVRARVKETLDRMLSQGQAVCKEKLTREVMRQLPTLAGEGVEVEIYLEVTERAVVMLVDQLFVQIGEEEKNSGTHEEQAEALTHVAALISAEGVKNLRELFDREGVTSLPALAAKRGATSLKELASGLRVVH